jgi:hypothetical protein
MSELVERVAKALYEDMFPHRAGYYGCEATRLSFEGHARAAIEAMREPTNEMHRAGDRAYQSPAAIWIAMIDEALRG